VTGARLTTFGVVFPEVNDMKELLQGHSRQIASSSLSRSWRILDLLHAASARVRTFTAVAVAVAWVPPAFFSALRGRTAFLSFLTDYATQTRFLIILPLLILAAPALSKRLGKVADHLEEFVLESQLSDFDANWTSFERLGNSMAAQVVIVLLTYTLALGLAQYLSPEGAEIVTWWKGGGAFSWFSPAGTWALFISYPILVCLALLWLWRQLLWTRFMRATARLDLRLIAAHPDSVGGIGFLESALRGQHAFSFCLGLGLTGAVANRVIHHGEKLTGFGPVAGVLVAAVLLICVAPYFVFTPVLMQLRRRGLLKYGAFARTAGEHFEKKWLERPDTLNQDVLTVGDFSAIHDLYGVVSNVNDIGVVPVSRVDLYALILVAFIPAIPVVIGSVPLDIVARAAMKMLF
jgi:hypothetical protein